MSIINLKLHATPPTRDHVAIMVGFQLQRPGWSLIFDFIWRRGAN